jgi:hypothetical protein
MTSKSWDIHIDKNDIDMLMAQYRQNLEKMLTAKSKRAASPPKPQPQPQRRSPSRSPSPRPQPLERQNSLRQWALRVANGAEPLFVEPACHQMTTAKYKPPRKSPPYDAEMCQNEIRTGNDEKIYQSVQNGKGDWRWVLMKLSPAAAAPAPKRPKSRSPPRAAARSPPRAAAAAAAPKRPKSRSPPRAAAAPSIQVMTKTMIRESLTPYSGRPEIEEYDNGLKMARRIFSPHVKYFTPKLVEKLKLKPGFTFWGLDGQGWSGAADEDDDNHRMAHLTKIKFQGFYNESEQHLEEPSYGDTSILYRAKYQEDNDMVINGYQAHACDFDRKMWGTGSGCDPVMIFISAAF